ncbi:hypothetical protein K474DRAFT_1756085, partial [Panus rudis PR-1116 ss-1]
MKLHVEHVNWRELDQQFPRLFRIKGRHGVITPRAREMIRDLVALGVPHQKIYSACLIVCAASDVVVDGSFDTHSITRIVREGYVASAVQTVHEIRHANSWTGSADGTGHKHVEHLAHHAYVRVQPSQAIPEAYCPRQRFLGVRAVTDKTSETQLETFDELVKEFVAYYNDSPLANSGPPLKLDEVLAKLKGWGSDHAEDQKKFVRLLQEWKREVEREARGERTLYSWASTAPAQFIAYLLRASEQMVQSAGGMEAWERLSPVEQEECAQPVLQRLKIEIGEEVFSGLSAEDQELIDRFVWAGCSMHKDLNAAKGGSTALQEFWEKVPADPPVPLPSRDNAAALSADANSTSGKRAASLSQGGAVKLTQLCGLVFNHHDDKKGQQDTYRNFFQHALSYIVHFPETSNTRFQSHCIAACELLVNLPLYLEFLDLIRDKKDKRNLNNIENNIYQGLRDTSTLTELAVLALYAQVISHPYMRVVRGHGHWNALTLGPFHAMVICHCETVIADPDVLLAADASYEKGALDGAQWERSEVFYVIQRMAPNLPFLRGALVAFFEGAVTTWRRFTSEFNQGGQITSMSAAERDEIAICATN